MGEHPRRALSQHALTLPAFLLAGWLLALPAAGAAQTTEGLAAYQAGDYAAALTLFEDAAQAGDASAAFGLGLMHQRGQGVAQDPTEALRWFEQAAMQGHPAAQYNLGKAMMAGDGAPAEPAKALRWYRRAADQGFGPAAYNLAVYFLADGAAGPSAQAYGIAWLDRAALLGVERAREGLATLSPTASMEPQRSEALLLAAPPDAHTIQLLSTGSLAAVEGFIAEHALNAPERFIYRYRLDGGLAWNLSFGLYPSAGEARDAIDSMRASLRVHGPWVRPVAPLQDRLRTLWRQRDGFDPSP